MRSIILILCLALVERVYSGDKCTISSRTNVDTELGYVNSTDQTTTIPLEVEDGEYIYIKCKKDSQTWTNDVRALSYVDTEVIDSLNGTVSNNSIRVNCTSGTYSPTILTDRTTWCGTGCPLIPTKPTTNWKAEYNALGVSTTGAAAPISQSSEYEITVSCMSGAAQEVGGDTVTTTYCTETGYSPDLGSLLDCVDGCSDLPHSGSGVTASKDASTTSGEAPYNIGDIVNLNCNSASYELTTSDQITCLSTQRWSDDEVPTCVLVTSSSQRTCSTRLVLLVLAVSFIACVMRHAEPIMRD